MNNPVSFLDANGLAVYLGQSGKEYNDGIDDGLKYLVDERELPSGPLSPGCLKRASIIAPDVASWDKLVRNIYAKIHPSRNIEDIGAYGIKDGVFTFVYGGESEDTWDGNGKPGQDGTRATLKAMRELGEQDYSVGVHSHPHPDATMEGKGYLSGRIYTFGPESQPPHQNDYTQHRRTGYNAGMVVTGFSIYTYKNTHNSIVRYSFGDVNKFIRR